MILNYAEVIKMWISKGERQTELELSWWREIHKQAGERLVLKYTKIISCLYPLDSL